MKGEEKYSKNLDSEMLSQHARIPRMAPKRIEKEGIVSIPIDGNTWNEKKISVPKKGNKREWKKET